MSALADDPLDTKPDASLFDHPEIGDQSIPPDIELDDFLAAAAAEQASPMLSATAYHEGSLAAAEALLAKGSGQLNAHRRELQKWQGTILASLRSRKAPQAAQLLIQALTGPEQAFDAQLASIGAEELKWALAALHGLRKQQPSPDQLPGLRQVVKLLETRLMVLLMRAETHDSLR